MRIKSGMIALLLLALPGFAAAQDMSQMAAEHGGATFHALRLETDMGRQNTASWDLDGWVGTDTNKLWLKSEGQLNGPKTEHAEAWALYSRNVSTFWDAQIGVRQDLKTRGNGKAHSYAAIGINGLAPYFFETEAHIFVRDDGHLSARFRQENEVLLTNRLVVRPRLELNLNGTADKTEALGTGVTDAAIGIQIRYDLTRTFAPYLDLKYEKKLGQTADFIRLRGEKPDSTTLNAGIRWLF